MVTVAGAVYTVGQETVGDAAGAPKPPGEPKPVVGAETNAAGLVANPVPGAVALPLGTPELVDCT